MKFGVRKLESWGYQMVKKSCRYSFLRFDTIPARDGQTDGQTDRHVAIAITRAGIASRGKKQIDTSLHRPKRDTTQYKFVCWKFFKSFLSDVVRTQATSRWRSCGWRTMNVSRRYSNRLSGARLQSWNRELSFQRCSFNRWLMYSTRLI